MAAIGAAFARAGQRVAAKVGRADETVDVAMNGEVAKFRNFYKRMKLINEHSKKVLILLKDLSVAQASLMEEFQAMHESGDEMYQVTVEAQKAFQEMEQARTDLEDAWKDDFNAPLAAYLGQYHEIEKRLQVRDTRRIDMDRYRGKVKSLQEKAQPNHAKINQTKEQFALAQEGYKELNAELMRDIPALYSDRKECLKPIMSVLIDSYVMYYGRISNKFGHCQSLCQHVDRRTAHNRARVITDPEISWAYREASLANINVDTVDTRAVAPAVVAAPAAAAPPSYQAEANPHLAAASAAPARNSSPGVMRNPAASGGGIAAGGGRPQPQPGKPAAKPKNKAAAKPFAKPAATPGAPDLPRAKALYQFRGQDNTELDFDPGDIILVKKQEGEWWTGEDQNGRTGLFPFNYVEML